ncbi:Dos2-interacting transcription regulator of RNA-Pol-II-domain-containing protein [Myxozyma melibiosi]|uniref:MMS19 nucleotide excision repair protein n=1 Tax=Myxozyma melibiosi TaxID=54550 RepID=A0ABR1F488_9ASCO
MSKQTIDQYLVSLGGVPDESDKIADQIANDLQSGTTRLVDFIQNLGPYLTDEDVGIRMKSLNCVSTVLTKLPTPQLNSRQITMLSAFLSEKLDDEECTKEAADGLLALLSMEHIAASSVKDMASAVFSKIDMKKHAQGVRYLVYQIIEKLFEKHLTVLKSMNDTTIDGFLQLVSGEKDPRNLMIGFSLLKTLAKEFDIEKSVEPLFDASFCYFPITFRPPPDDPYGITSEDLKLKLRESIAASPLFAPFAFPSLIEKLTSSSLSVKKDAILTMSACIESYGTVTVSEYWEKLFNAVKFEVLHDGEEDVPNLVCDLLKVLTRTLAFGQLRVIDDSPLDLFLKAVVAECKPHMTNLDSRQAKPASKILSSVAEASYISFDAAAEGVLVSILNLVDFASTATLSEQKTALESLMAFIEASGNLYGWRTEAVRTSKRENGLLPYKDSFFEVFCKGFVSVPAEEVSFKLLALQGIVRMSLLHSFLDESEMGLVVQYLDETVLTQQNESLCAAALSSLQALGRVKADLILNIAFPAFLSQLPDPELGNIETPTSSTKHYRIILSALADLCIDKGIFDTLTVRLLNRLPSAAKSDDNNADFTQSILAAILLVLQRKIGEEDWDWLYFFQTLVPKLFSVVIAAALELNTQLHPALYAPASVAIAGKIINLLVRSVPVEAQTLFTQELFNLFVSSKDSALISEQYRPQVSILYKPLSSDSTGPEGLVELFTAAVAGLRREISLPVSNALEFAANIVTVSETRKNPQDRLALLRLVALIVSKWFSKEDDAVFLNTTVAQLRKTLAESEDLQERIISLEQISWIVKAYVFKSNRQSFETIEQVIGLLRDAEMGPYACKACGIMISDDEIVDKANYVVVRLLAKQSYFSFCVVKIVDGFSSSVDTASKRHYLVALSTILQHMPGKIVLPQLQTFLPLLLQSLSVDDAQVKLASIDTISATMADASATMTEHLSTIIPRLLQATVPKPSNPANVRAAALSALASFTKTIAADSLRPFRAEIIRKLLPVLDDARRDVRKAAVDCRQAYFAMEA